MDLGQKRARLVRKEEFFDRNGHWYREFTSRGEVLPILEHWVSEHGYSLVGMRGKRRVYAKCIRQSWVMTLLDVRVEERHVVMSAWIQVGWLARLVRFLPARLAIDPSGFRGVFARRPACHDLNSLLVRLKQRPIAGSEGWHIADSEPTTLLLSLKLLLGLTLFAVAMIAKQPFYLLPHTLPLLGRPLGWLTGTALVLILVHYYALVRQVPEMLYRSISSGLSALAFSIVSLVLFGYLSNDVAVARVSFQCLKETQREACTSAIDSLSPKHRQAVLIKLTDMQKELALKTRAN